ncbi:MAG: hypothetical protein ACTS78_01180 [Arsenophonus sp. NC-WZS1-MAG3]
MHNLLLSNNYIDKSKIFNHFILILSTLYNFNKQVFMAATEANNRKNGYLFY